MATVQHPILCGMRTREAAERHHGEIAGIRMGGDNARGNQLFQLYLKAFRRKFEFDPRFGRRQIHDHVVLVYHG